MSVSPDRPLSVVLLGYGLGGRVFHAPLIRAVPGLSLDGIVTSDADRQLQARAAHPGAAIYDTADAAWAGDHDLAVISTANVTHVPLTEAALGNGLHVVIDKPMAPSAPVAQLLARRAESMGLRIIPFQNRRWDSDFRTALQVARDGSIGTMHRFESNIQRMRVVPKPGWRNSTDPADMGGMLYDLGAHLVDQALLLMGPVVRVSATVRSVRVSGGTDDDVLIELDHESGAVSQLAASQIGAFDTPRLTLLGTRGGLRIDASDTQEPELAAGHDPAEPDWGREPATSAALLRTYDDANALTEERVPLTRGEWPAFYLGVERALRGSAEPPVAVDDVIANLRVLDAAREAGLSGSSVRLDPPAGHRASSMS